LALTFAQEGEQAPNAPGEDALCPSPRFDICRVRR